MNNKISSGLGTKRARSKAASGLGSIKLAEQLAQRLSQPGLSLFANMPSGYDALMLGMIAVKLGAARPLLHVARDDARLAWLAEMVPFFAPTLPILTIPAWDCLPYDRVSPNAEISAWRVDSLASLAERQASGGPLLVLTTFSALLQRVPKRITLKGTKFTAKPGDFLTLEKLTNFLNGHGYVRRETVTEPGEYAVRGGIFDLFPPGTEDPLRLDFFGDTLEGIRLFDPLNQRSAGNLEQFEIRQVSELILKKEPIAQFRSGYREHFGAILEEDELYEAVSAGKRHPGMEHWLPLFHDGLETLFDYLPKAVIGFDPESEAAREARFEMIDDHYASRLEFSTQKGKGKTPFHTTSYKPLLPHLLYLERDELEALLRERPVFLLANGAVPPGPNCVDTVGRPGRDFIDVRTRPDLELYSEIAHTIAAAREQGLRIVITATSNGNRERLFRLLEEHGITGLSKIDKWSVIQVLERDRIAMIVLPLDRGFVSPEMAVISESDIFGDRLIRSNRRTRKAEAFLSEISDLSEGDFVVHIDHGIGRYEGLQTIEVGGAPHDCLALMYDGGRLFVPVENMEMLTRFGSADSGATLDRLGAAAWQSRKARVRKRIRDIADRLIALAAERHLQKGAMMEPPGGLWEEFAARFAYEETEDQLSAIADVVEDLGSGRPMDRLICGDVGFGKTEVALRAAMLVAMTGAQVAVVVPTTLLARQHYRVFTERFNGLPLRIVQLSRMVQPREAILVRKALADGTADIVIGTHALLAKSVCFSRLGMLIIDEEQRFGVRQKERLKEFRTEVHVLTLTATPIPRTMQMAMSGVRDLSLIATPPIDRLAIRTYVTPYDSVTIREALLREQFRGGQSYFVCPRILDIDKLYDELRELVPELRIGVAHGQMPMPALDEVMNGFYDRQFDLLLSTNIVESGLDVSNANTMIIHRADMFGLAQLYQLRGRIGRAKIRGYAYLTTIPGKILTEQAKKRLKVMETLDSLGAGFTIASHDMDIRGAGNLLGEEQSGHIREVGIELYQQMLEEAVATARNKNEITVQEVSNENWTPQISIGTAVLIPEDYVRDLGLRLGLYRRLSQLSEGTEIEAFAAELIDRFGPLPEAVDNLCKLVAIKQLCRVAGVERIDAGPKGAVISFHKNIFAEPEALLRLIANQTGTMHVRPDQKLVYRRNWQQHEQRVLGVHHVIEQLAGLVMRTG